MRKLIAGMVAVLLAAVSAFPVQAISAQSAIVLDASTGQLLSRGEAASPILEVVPSGSRLRFMMENGSMGLFYPNTQTISAISYFTDDLTMGAVSKRWSVGEAAVLAVEAGCDQLLVCHGRENAVAARDALLAAVESGRLSMSRLEESVRRILALKETLGLTDAPVPTPDMEGLAAQAEELRAAVGR